MHLLLEPLLRLFATLVSRGGEPRQNSGEGIAGIGLLYPLRPGTFLFLLGCLAFLAVILVHNLPLLLRGDFNHLQRRALPLALFLGAVSLSLLTRTVLLDEAGLSVRYRVSPRRLISWSALSHVELQQSRSSGRGTWFFRSTPAPSTGRITTIILPEMSYNVSHLLAEIDRRHPLQVTPYHRRHWYGG
jgi:hypothetical protein